MQLRSYLLAGLATALCFGAPAFAASPAATATSKPAVADHLVTVAAKSPAAELKLLKKKKKPTDADLARIQELEKQIKAEKAAAAAKALEARKLAMREAAKAKADSAREAFLARKGQAEIDAKPAAKLAEAKKKPVKTEEPVQLAVAEPIPPEAQEIALTGNSGELRSEVKGAQQDTGLFAGLFGGGVTRQAMLPQTRALDQALEKKESKRKFTVRPEFEPQVVDFPGYSPGTIVINTGEHRLYLVESFGTARRYAIAVGRDGLQYKGTVAVGDKQEWPRWIPTKEMQERDPKKYGRYKDGMNGGPNNPLGARAIYLYQGKKDTYLRIHGTTEPQSIGTNASNGCFRMINDHVIDLYRRVKVGTQVVVL